MALKFLHAQADDHPGEWRDWAKYQGSDGKERTSKMLLRPIPDEIDKALRAKHGIGVTRYRTEFRKKAGGSVREHILKAQPYLDYQLDRAAYSMLETEDFTIDTASPKTAKALSQLLGIEVEVGVEVCLDKRWGEPLTLDDLKRGALGVRGALLAGMTEAAAFASDTAGEIGENEVIEKQKREEDLAGN